MPYAIEVIETGEIIRRYSALPPSFQLPDGRRIISPVAVGDEGLGFRFIEIVQVNFSAPGPYYTKGEDIVTRDGAVVTITRQWTAWTQQEIDDFETARLDGIVNRFDATEDILRAAVLVIMDELNRHATLSEAILQAAADASNLAGFKASMALIQPVPQRTAAQMKTAIRAKIGA